MEEDDLTPEQAIRVRKRVMHIFKDKVADEAKKGEEGSCPTPST
jgi:hypothetical protein